MGTEGVKVEVGRKDEGQDAYLEGKEEGQNAYLKHLSNSTDAASPGNSLSWSTRFALRLMPLSMIT